MWTETIKILELCVCNLFLEEIHSPSFMNCSLVLAPEGGGLELPPGAMLAYTAAP